MTSVMHQDIPIFDSLSHPSLDGSWLSPRWNGQNSFKQVVASMREANVRWAWAVAMGTTGAYDLDRYVQECRQHAVRLFPAAFMDVSAFSGLAMAEDWLGHCQRRGYLGIKLHPRLARFDFQHPLLPGVIRAANLLGLTVMLCTYCYSADPQCSRLSIENLRKLLHAVSEEKLVLLHGGTVRVLELAEMTRFFKATLLDLSWTLCELAGSSLDLDLRYVLDRCRERVCIGSDSPEYAPSRMRTRFAQLTEGFERTHIERIAYRNLFAFTGLPSEP